MVKINVDSESRAAYTCFRIARNCQSLAYYMASEDWEIQHHCTTGIVFVAFSIEAMINHFGKIMFPGEWESKRQSRKEQHRMLFKEVNLPNYLGSTNYQIAKRCFVVRDLFAHGKTRQENLELPVSQDVSFEEQLMKVMDAPTSMESLISIEYLDLYIETAEKIQDDIQEYGYYPNQEHLPQEQREKLRECPLSFTGVKSF